METQQLRRYIVYRKENKTWKHKGFCLTIFIHQEFPRVRNELACVLDATRALRYIRIDLLPKFVL